MIGRLSRVDLVERLKVADSISNFLMPMSYDPETGFFTLADLSVGAAYEIEPLASSALSGETLITHAESLARSIRNLQPHAIIQIMLVPDRSVEADLGDFEAMGGEDVQVLLKHREQVARHFRESIDQPLFNISYGEGAFQTRRYRLIACVVHRPDRMVSGASASMSDFIRNLFGRRSSDPEDRERSQHQRGGNPAERRFNHMRDDMIRELGDQCRRFESNMRAAHMPVERLDAEALIRLTSVLLAPTSANPDVIHWDPAQQISHQVAFSDVAVEAATGSILTDSQVFKVVTMAGIPQGTWPGMLSMPSQDISWASLLDFLGDGIICLSGAVMPKDDVRRYIDRRKQKVLGGFSIQSKRDLLVQDCELMSHYIENDKRSVLQAQVTFLVRGPSELAAQQKAERFRDKVLALGIDARVERHYAPSLYFQSLPFGFAPTIPEARRLHMVVDRTFADLVPIYLQSRGTRSAGALMHNRLGEPLRLNLFDAPGAAHALVVGDSGSGKSFGVLYLLYNFLARPKSQGFFFDKGGSASMAATMLGDRAAIHRMGVSSGATVINVCAGTYETTGAFLKSFLAHLASQSVADRLDSDQIGILEDAIKAAFVKKRRESRYNDYAELTSRHRDVWVHQARKRFTALPMDDMRFAAVQQLKFREGGRAPVFEIYHLGYLKGRRLSDPESKEETGYRPFHDARAVDTESRPWLENRGILIEDVQDSDGRVFAGVLFQNPSDLRTMQIEGFDIEADDSLLVVECERREDIAELVQCGVEMVLPEDWLDQRRRRLTAAVRAEHPGAPADAVRDIVATRAAKLTGVDLWDDIDGWAILQEEVVLRDVIEELKLHREQDHAQRLVRRLGPYYGSGSAAGFFDGKMGFDFTGRKLVVLELGELQTAGEHLLAAVVGALLQMIILYCQSEHLPGGGPRSFAKYVILDEIWALISVPLIRELLHNALRTMRKHRTSVVAISQFVREFKETEGGDVIVSSATYKIFLKQPHPDIQQFGDWLGWPAEKVNLMYGVHSSQPRGLYSEMLIDAPALGVCEIARFCADPYSYWLFTTDPDDLAERERLIQEYRARGADPDEARSRALEDLAAALPNGVAAGSTGR